MVIAVGFLMTTPVVGVLMSLGGTTARQLASLASPVSLVSGLEAWIYRTDVQDIGGFGPVYLLVAVALVAVSTAVLLLRYRKVAPMTRLTPAPRRRPRTRSSCAASPAGTATWSRSTTSR